MNNNIWQENNLNKVCNIYQPKTITSKDISDSGIYKVFGANGVIGYFDKYNHEYSEVLMTCRGATCGTINLSEAKSWITGNAMVIQPKNINYLNKIYLYYFLHYINPRSLISGSAQPQITRQAFINVKIPTPEFKIQQKIALILSTIDEEIQKTDQIIKKTEKLKNSLIENIFEIEAINEKWPKKKLSEIAEVQRGRFSARPRNDPKYYGGNIPFIQTSDIVKCNGIIRNFSQTLNEDGLRVSKLFKKGTIVLTIAANIGDTGILSFDSCFPDSLVGIIPNEDIDILYLEYYLRSKKSYLNSISTQSAQKNINLAKLNPLIILVPSLEKQKQIASVLGSLDQKNELERQYKNYLIKLKNGLMNDIFSQKVEVKIV